MSLHARVANLPVEGWADRSLCQIWGPRGALYLIDKADFPVFTIGRLPRAGASALQALAEEVAEQLGNDHVDPRDVMAAVGRDPLEIRDLSRSGRLVVVWDASRVTVQAVPAPNTDPVAAQRELARRFLRILGPATKKAFQTWSRISQADTTTTWRELESELTEVTPGRYLLTEYANLWHDDNQVNGVRLLPGDDPLLRLDRDQLLPDPTQRTTLFPPHPTGVLRGAILVDGQITGWWDRQATKVRLHPFQTNTPRLEEIKAEAWQLPIPGGITKVD